MEIKFIKDHVLISKVVPKGTIVGVTNGLGEDLINKGIAIDVTLKYQKQVTKRKEEQIAEQEELANKADEDRVDMLAEKVAEKIGNKKNNKTTKK